jgi:hypothetical protein
MIYTAPCVMLLMRAASIMRASGRGMGPGFETFLGPVKWHLKVEMLCTGAFLYAPYSFLLISNKLTKLISQYALFHCIAESFVEVIIM